MSITIHLRTPCGESRTIDADGGMTIANLYTLSSEAIGITDGTFELRFDGEPLQRSADTLVESSGMCEGSEVAMVYRDPLSVHVSDLRDTIIRERVTKALGEDPKGVLVVDVTGVAGELVIPMLPEGVKHVAIVCTPAETYITRLGNDFLRSAAIETLDMRAIVGVQQIGDSFMMLCRSLRSVEMCDMSNVTRIPDNFLCDCTRLTSVDLSTFSNVTSIGKYFLAHTDIRAIDLSPFHNVQTIGTSFLAHCRSLHEVDLQPLHYAEVSESILGGCPPGTRITATAFSMAHWKLRSRSEATLNTVYGGPKDTVRNLLALVKFNVKRMSG